MKIRVYSEGGYSTGGFTSGGGTMTGTLTLAGNPIMELEAAPKQYVDASVLSLSASNLTSGTIPVARLPALSGDASSTVNTNVLTLAASGVTAGTYPKVIVDAKGRVIGGSALVAADIPSLDWSKIGSGKPTTLSGYGITNGFNVSGGSLTGFLTLHANPTTTLHAATKGYVDTALSAASGLAVGDVIRKPYSITPSGFLKCNGAYVSQTTYSGLFAVIGNTFDVSTGVDYNDFGAVGSGQPWRQQYDINSTQSTDITGWTTGTSLPGTVYRSQGMATKNRVYILGGIINSVHSGVVYTAPINADGTLGTWTTGTSLPGNVLYSFPIVTKNRVYLLGGAYVNFACTTILYTAPINADGTLGAWTTSTPLPMAIEFSQAIVTKNRVYILSGSAGTVVYTAPINADGTLGAWTDSGNNLPVSLSWSQAIVTKNRVYMLGGGVAATASTVYTATINADGTLGAWSAGTSLPVAVTQSLTIVTKNRVYLLGGLINSTYSAVVYTAPINADGTLGTWTTGTSLPVTVSYSIAIATKNRVHILGGQQNGATSAVVYTAPINGSLNDYSAYYDGSINKFDGSGVEATTNPSPSTQFRLPDTTVEDTDDKVYHYIKI